MKLVNLLVGSAAFCSSAFALTHAEQKALKQQQKANFARKKAEVDAKIEARKAAHRQRLAQMRAKFNLNQLMVQQAKIAAKQVFSEKKAEQRLNWDTKHAGMRDSSMKCVKNSDVSVSWVDGTAFINVSNVELASFKAGAVAVGTSIGHVGSEYMLVLIGDENEHVYAVEVSSFDGQGTMSAKTSKREEFENRMWSISDSAQLGNDADGGMVFYMAHDGAAGAELDWYFCSSRDNSNPCSGNPCENGGVCSLNAAMDDFQCACASGFEGDRCESCSCTADQISDPAICAIDCSIRFDNPCAGKQHYCGSDNPMIFMPCSVVEILTPGCGL